MGRLAGPLRRIAFVYLTALIAVMGSERVYWYWAGLTAGSTLEMALFYAVPVSVTLWGLALVPARRFPQVVLGGAIFAFLVEGVLTPVLYADGPLPALASLFVGWHGVLVFAGMWYLVHRWLVVGRTRLLAGVSVVFGALWGVWAFVAALADTVDAPPGSGTVLTPSAFAVYALGVGVVLALAHWSIGFVWPAAWRPSRTSTWIVGLVAAAYFVVAVLPVVPWAPAKLVILLAGTYLLMRRGSAAASTDEATVLDAAAGPVRLTATAPLLLAPVAASLTYGTAWVADPPSTLLTAGYWVLVTGQVVGGAATYLWAALRAVSRRGRSVSGSAGPLPGEDGPGLRDSSGGTAGPSGRSGSATATRRGRR